jgi:hypothetical protein
MYKLIKSNFIFFPPDAIRGGGEGRAGTEARRAQGERAEQARRAQGERAEQARRAQGEHAEEVRRV